MKSRRTVLKAAAVSAFSTPFIGSVSGSSHAETSAKLRGTVSNPVSRSDIKKLQEEYLEPLAKEGDGVARSGAEANPEKAVIAYNLKITQDGPQEEYILTGADTSVSEPAARRDNGHTQTDERSISTSRVNTLHEKADQWLSHSSETELVESSPEDDAQIQSLPDDWDDWSLMGDTFYWLDEPPYGRVLWDFDFRKHPDEEGYALQTGFDMESGRVRNDYGDDDYERYQNKSCWVEHDWDTPANFDPTVRDRYPRGQIDDEVVSRSVNLGADSSGAITAGVSYGYSQPATTVEDRSTMSDNITRAELSNSPDSSGARTNAHFNPASYADALDRFEDCDPGTSGDRSAVDISIEVEWGMTSWAGWTLINSEDYNHWFELHCWA